MFEIAFAIGIFSFCIYFLGLAGLLYKPLVIFVTLIYWIGFVFLKREDCKRLLERITFKNVPLLFALSSGYLILQSLINSIGLFGPEIGFDATWYHLTFAKLYLMYHAVLHFPGSILYYSDMPKLTEMLFTAGLAFGSDFWARGVEYLFGILTLIAVYKLGRKFLSPLWAILLPVIFYSNLVVGWESFSGYIDLARTFFTVVTLLSFITWRQKKEQKYFYYTAVLLGLTLCTKLLALPDLLLYVVAIFFVEKNQVLSKKLKDSITFVIIALLIPLPYFTFSLIHTGNPFYPMLSKAYQVSNYWQIFNPLYLITSFWQTFAFASDPINPLFLAMIPFIIWQWKRLWREIPLIVIIGIGGIVCWYITPQTGGGRYILPYLPALSLACVYLISQLEKKWQKVFLTFIFAAAFISLIYRAGANAKFLPVIFHKETEAQFMTKNLQFNLGDFYDIDGYFAKNIKPTDRVLLYGFHNLYYVDFPYIDSQWVQKGDTFDYVAVQGTGMPSRFAYWNLVYFNATTHVRLYTFNKQQWYY